MPRFSFVPPKTNLRPTGPVPAGRTMEPQENSCLSPSNRKRGRKLNLSGFKKSPNRVLRSNTPLPARKAPRRTASPKQITKEISNIMAPKKTTLNVSSEITSATYSSSNNLNPNNTASRESQQSTTAENCENFSPTRNDANTLPKTPTKSSVNNPIRSPVQTMLRQLQSDLSPKYISPSTPPSSARCSRYGRVQKTKSSTDYLDINLAIAVQRSIRDKIGSPTKNTPSPLRPNGSTSTNSTEDLLATYNVDLKRSPTSRKEYISPIQSLIIKNKVARDVIEKSGNSPTILPILGSDYDRKGRPKSGNSNDLNNIIAAKNTRQITERTLRVSPQSTHPIIDFDLAIERSIVMKPTQKTENQLELIQLKKVNPVGSKKASIQSRRLIIPMPPLFSDAPSPNAEKLDFQPSSPIKALRKYVSPTNSPVKASAVEIAEDGSPNKAVVFNINIPKMSPDTSESEFKLRKDTSLKSPIKEPAKKSPIKDTAAMSPRNPSTNAKIQLPKYNASPNPPSPRKPKEGIDQNIKILSDNDSIMQSTTTENQRLSECSVLLTKPTDNNIEADSGKESSLESNPSTDNFTKQTSHRTYGSVKSKTQKKMLPVTTTSKLDPIMLETVENGVFVNSPPKLKTSTHKLFSPQISYTSPSSSTSEKLTDNILSEKMCKDPLPSVKEIKLNQTPTKTSHVNTLEQHISPINTNGISSLNTNTSTPHKAQTVQGINGQLTVSPRAQNQSKCYYAFMPNTVSNSIQVKSDVKSNVSPIKQSMLVTTQNTLLIKINCSPKDNKLPLKPTTDSPKKRNNNLMLESSHTSESPSKAISNSPSKQISPTTNKIHKSLNNHTSSPTKTTIEFQSEIFKKPSPKSAIRNQTTIRQSPIVTSPEETITSDENAVDFLISQYHMSPKNRRRLLSLSKQDAQEIIETADEPENSIIADVSVTSKKNSMDETTSGIISLITKIPEENPTPLSTVSTDSFEYTDVNTNFGLTNTEECNELSSGANTEPKRSHNASFECEPCPSVSSEDSAKGSSIADEDPSNANKIVDNYQVGDLAWARIGNYPYWPCLVCNSPEGLHVSYTTGKKSQRRIHIRFLADNGRRSWTPTICMMPFTSIEDFEAKKRGLPSNIKAKDPRVRAFTVSPAKLILWSQAILEAQMLAVVPNKRRPIILEKKLEDETKPKKPQTITKHRLSVASLDSFDSVLAENVQRNNTSTPCITSPRQTYAACDPHGMRMLSRSPTPESPEYEELSINLPVSDGNETDNKIQNYLLSISNDASTSPGPEHGHHDGATDDATVDVTDNLEMMANDKEFLEYFRNTKHHFMDSCDARTEMHIKHLMLKMFMLQRMKGSIKKSGGKRRAHTNDNTLADEEPPSKKKRIDIESKSGRNNVASVRKSSRMSMAEYKAKRISDAEPEIDKKKELIDAAESEAQAAKVALRAARAAEKEKRELEEMSKYFMKEYPKNILFRGLNKELVCRFCHETGELVKCHTATCNEYMHHLCATDPEAALAKKSMPKVNKKSMESIDESESLVHVTGDLISESSEVDYTTHSELATTLSPPYCPDCAPTKQQVCFVCKINNGTELKCTEKQCGRQFHAACLKYWPQNKIISDHQLLCPCHVCHTCISDDPRGKHHHIKSSKLIKCVKCPATYHIDSCCIPAGCQLLTGSQLICPRHRVEIRKPVNGNWCFICSRGGELVCCETCPTAFHAACLRVPVPDTCYICEECETGRYPLYGEIVWAKIGSCKWWPAVVVPPNEIPDTILAVKRQPHNFAIRFFGARNYSWISRGFVFLYQEDDSDYSAGFDSKPDKVYERALVEAKAYAAKLREIDEKYVNPEKDRFIKPLPFAKIKTNRPIAPVRLSVACDEEEERICQCSSKDDGPCGPQSSCLNRALSIECDPVTCPAGLDCQNQRFEKRQYPNLIEKRTEGKGWGLVTLDAIPAGAFIIEYVGELINRKEFERRIVVMQKVKDEHYYFMTVTADLMIDAGPRGNSARFINHSCEPNCETQYWLVKGNTRVGLFALVDIPPNTELTFNYNLECIGELKKPCFCGANKCAGFIGAKFVEPPKSIEQKKGRGRKSVHKSNAANPSKKKKQHIEQQQTVDRE